jgi:hypothetical protein
MPKADLGVIKFKSKNKKEIAAGQESDNSFKNEDSESDHDG